MRGRLQARGPGTKPPNYGNVVLALTKARSVAGEMEMYINYLALSLWLKHIDPVIPVSSSVN